jgi:hypothetical protein
MKRCACGTRHTLADIFRETWGFQRSNGMPELGTLALFDCVGGCQSTLAVELPNPTIKEDENALRSSQA